MAKQADEITLQQADVVLILQQEDGERAGGRGQGAPAMVGAHWHGRPTPAPWPRKQLLHTLMVA